MKISIGTEIMLGAIVSGLLWMLFGVCIIRKTMPSLIIGAVIVAIIAGIYVLILFFIRRTGDEMYHNSLLKSKAMTYDVFLCAIMILSIICSVIQIFHLNFEMNWQGSIMFIVGMMNFLSGIYLYRLEKGKKW